MYGGLGEFSSANVTGNELRLQEDGPFGSPDLLFVAGGQTFRIGASSTSLAIGGWPGSSLAVRTDGIKSSRTVWYVRK